jgi:hypothetical protein
MRWKKNATNVLRKKKKWGFRLQIWKLVLRLLRPESAAVPAAASSAWGTCLGEGAVAHLA